MSHPLSTQEILDYCADVKVLGRRELRFVFKLLMLNNDMTLLEDADCIWCHFFVYSV